MDRAEALERIKIRLADLPDDRVEALAEIVDAWAHPTVFFAALAVAVVMMLAMIWILAKFVRGLARRLSGGFGAGRQTSM